MPDDGSGLGLFGGAFDPPHRGHVELLVQARAQLGLRRIVVLVVAAPGHKHVDTPADLRLLLARAAFPDDEVVLDPHPRTVDTLRAHPEWVDPTFLVGADEFCAFPAWKEPDEVLRLARIGVATRPGFPRERLDAALRALSRPDRVGFFAIEPTPVASSELRSRLVAGEDVDGDVPAAALSIIRAEHLYTG
ncbi:MAG TPA: nicotinate-nicotinamide nucleotide adenylyltransferase [Gaiellaceae bacterium]